jgi:hypothetical protein
MDCGNPKYIQIYWITVTRYNYQSEVWNIAQLYKSSEHANLPILPNDSAIPRVNYATSLFLASSHSPPKNKEEKKTHVIVIVIGIVMKKR